jgi:cation diffusion facilitator family transporter
LRLDEKHPILISILFNIVAIMVKAAIFSNTLSRAVYSEIFHSIGDTSNSLTLYIGTRASRAKPSPRYPFGVGKALYLSSLFSSIILGGSIFYMIIAENLRIYSSAEIHVIASGGHLYWLYMLALSLFDTATLILSVKIMRAREGRSIVLAPLVLEDLMGISGNIMASASLILSNTIADLVFSSVIAFITLAGSIHIGYRSIEALLGHSAPKEVIARIVKISLSIPGVVDVNDVKTMLIDPDRYLAIVQIEVKEDMTIKEVEEIKEEIVDSIKKNLPEIQYLILDIVKPKEPAKSYVSLLREIKEI